MGVVNESTWADMKIRLLCGAGVVGVECAEPVHCCKVTQYALFIVAFLFVAD